MTSVITRPDVDLADGRFYADRAAAHEAYRWMRANEPVFRDRNGQAAVTTYQSVLDAEQMQPVQSDGDGADWMDEGSEEGETR